MYYQPERQPVVIDLEETDDLMPPPTSHFPHAHHRVNVDPVSKPAETPLGRNIFTYNAPPVRTFDAVKYHQV